MPTSGKPTDIAADLESCRLHLISCSPFRGSTTAWNHPQTWRDFSAIYICMDGDGYVRSRGVTFPMTRGRVIVMPAGDVMDLGCRTEVAKWSVCLTLTLHSGRDLLWGLPTYVAGDYDPDQLTHYSSRVAQYRTATWFQLQSLVWQWLAPISPAIARNIRQERLFRDRYRPLLDAMGDTPQASTRVSDLAEAMHMSLPSLSRAFKRDHGLSLKQFLNQRLNQEACELLLSSRHSAAAVARRLGFQDELYFYRFFRKMNGATPNAFRRSNQVLV